MCEYIHSGLWSSPRASVASRRHLISDFLFSGIRSELGTESEQVQATNYSAGVLGIQPIFSARYITWHGGGLKF